MKKFMFCLLVLSMVIGLPFSYADAQQGKKAWTLLLYFVPDEKIENSLIGNINDIAKVGSGQDLNIVLMFDYASSKPTTYYYIDRGGVKKIKELRGITFSFLKNSFKTEHLFFEIIMNSFMLFESRVRDIEHIILFLFKMILSIIYKCIKS